MGGFSILLYVQGKGYEAQIEITLGPPAPNLEHTPNRIYGDGVTSLTRDASASYLNIPLDALRRKKYKNT